MYNENYIEKLVPMSAKLSQINLIIEKNFLDKESDIKKQYCNLRKPILAWLEESNRKPENDGQQ